jgi:Ca2+/H+ antiporter
MAMLAGSLVLTAAVIFDGRTSRLRGGILIAGYVVVAIVFFQAGDRF